jgi:hypothetical protein
MPNGENRTPSTVAAGDTPRISITVGEISTLWTTLSFIPCLMFGLAA